MFAGPWACAGGSHCHEGLAGFQANSDTFPAGLLRDAVSLETLLRFHGYPRWARPCGSLWVTKTDVLYALRPLYMYVLPSICESFVYFLSICVNSCVFYFFACFLGAGFDVVLWFYETSFYTKDEFVTLFAAICHLPFWCYVRQFWLHRIKRCFLGVRDTEFFPRDLCVPLRNSIVAISGRNAENRAVHFPLFPAPSSHGLWATCQSPRWGQPGTDRDLPVISPERAVPEAWGPSWESESSVRTASRGVLLPVVGAPRDPLARGALPTSRVRGGAGQSWADGRAPGLGGGVVPTHAAAAWLRDAVEQGGPRGRKDRHGRGHAVASWCGC